MSQLVEEPAIDGWFTMESESAHLIGSRCDNCGTYYFPKELSHCRNPRCGGNEFTEVRLSRIGKLWSYTNACYKPPEPFVASEPFEPFAIAAVELEKEKMIVLGQMASGSELHHLKIGDHVELVIEPLHESNGVKKMIWKWRPV